MARIEAPFPLEKFLDWSGIVKENKICLMDADFIPHITDSRAQKVIVQDLIDDVEVMKKCYRTFALEMCEGLTSVIRDPIIFNFSGKSSNTFRYHIAIEKEYKAGRGKKDLTIEDELLRMDLMFEAKKAIFEKYVCLLFDDLEADDLLCMLQDEHTYIYSKDKDLLQVPGYHYNIAENKVYEITQEQSVTFLAKQLLMGDNTDCIPGIKGVGPKTADKLLANVEPKNMINFVFKEYKQRYGIIEGTDRFANTWSLVKMRESYGTYIQKKYESAFSLKESIKKNHLSLNP